MGSGPSTSRERAATKGRPLNTAPVYAVPQSPKTRSTKARAYRGQRAVATTSGQQRQPHQQAAVRLSQNDPEYPEYPPRRVYTFTEQTDKQTKGDGLDNRNQRTHNLVTYNQQQEPESVHVLHEDHVQREGKNSKFQSHTTQSNFVKSTTTVSSGRSLDQARGISTVQQNGTSFGPAYAQGGLQSRVQHQVDGRGVSGESRQHSAHATRTVNHHKPDVIINQTGSPTQPAHTYVIQDNRHATRPERQSRPRTRARNQQLQQSRSASQHSVISGDSTDKKQTVTATGRSRHRSAGSSHTALDANHNTTKMPRSRKRPNNSQSLAECKVRYLGRYLTQELSEDSLSKLRSHIRMVSGLKTKLKLTNLGIRSGNKYGTLFKHKVQVEFVPMDEIYDVFLDSVYLNLLLVVTQLPGGSYDILAYRVDNDYDGRRMEHEYAQLAAFVAAGSMQNFSPATLQSQGNWTLHPPTNGYYDYQDSTLRKANSMNDILYKNTLRSCDSTDWRDGGLRSRSQSRDRYTARSRSRERSADQLSTASALSVESMKAEIENLTREVRHLRSLVDERSRQGDGASQKDTDDEVFQPMQVNSERAPGKLVDSNNGTVKVKVGDYRKRGHSASTHVTGTTQRHDVDQRDGPIRLVYNGNSFDSSDSGVPQGRAVSRDPSTSTNASQRLYRGTARERVAHQQRDSGGVYATVQRSGRSSPRPRSVSHSSADYHTTPRARSTEHYLAAAQNAYSVSGPPPHGSRAARSRQGVVYRTHPENPHVAMRPQRAHSASRYEARVPFY